MSQYKYKLKEAPEETTAKVGGKFRVGDTQVSKGIKYTVTDIDKETGKISWDVDYLPNLTQLFDATTELTNVSKKVYQKAKKDPKFREIYEDAKDIKNKIRTHVRNEYPEDYKRITTRGMDENLNEVHKLLRQDSLSPSEWAKAKKLKGFDPKNYLWDKKQELHIIRQMYSHTDKLNPYTGEEEVDEISTSGAAGGYNTPYAFRRKGQKADDKAYKELGYKSVNENKFYVTVNRGHGDGKFLVKSSESEYTEPRIFSRDEAEDYVKRASKSGATPGRQYAYWVSDINMDRIDENNSCTTQFKYKLVPKKIKGSGIIVKQIFEDEGRIKFQKQRIDAFDGIEKKLNNIYTMISNAKNETAEYYKDHPKSYLVVKPTDLISDYLEDIEKLLKGE